MIDDKIKLLNDLSWLESQAKPYEMKCSRGPCEGRHFPPINQLHETEEGVPGLAQGHRRKI